MYLQITTRCNMHCAHCGMNCKAKGEDMDIETVRNAFRRLDGDYVSIGGGEPTLHPLFWQILMEATANSESVWLATNGSQTIIALTLARLAQKGIVGVALSLDCFHDPIEESVITAFQHKPAGSSDHNDQREIRDSTYKLVKAGRCKDGEPGCICPELFIKPNGDVRACGCVRAPCFGNVNTEINIPDTYVNGKCSKGKKYNAQVKTTSDT